MAEWLIRIHRYTYAYTERARALEAAAAAATAPEHEEGQRQQRGRLYGLPVLIKDMIPVEGVRFVRG